MKSKELAMVTFNIACQEEEKKPEIKKVIGYSFFYKNDLWFLRYKSIEKCWAIVHPETGFIACEDFSQGGAILRLIKILYDNPQPFHNDAIENAKKVLIENGIKLPVNPGDKND